MGGMDFHKNITHDDAAQFDNEGESDVVLGLIGTGLYNVLLS